MITILKSCCAFYFGMEKYIRCNTCGEFYENNIDSLTEHYYGDNVYARYHNEIYSNQIEVKNTFSGSWLQRVFNFKKPKISHSALEELLDYKKQMNNKLCSPVTSEIKSEQK